MITKTCVKCGFTYDHSLTYLAPHMVSVNGFIGECLIVTCKVCDYESRLPCADAEA
jgi:hypothetical protein